MSISWRADELRDKCCAVGGVAESASVQQRDATDAENALVRAGPFLRKRCLFRFAFTCVIFGFARRRRERCVR